MKTVETLRVTYPSESLDFEEKLPGIAEIKRDFSGDILVVKQGLSGIDLTFEVKVERVNEFRRRLTVLDFIVTEEPTTSRGLGLGRAKEHEEVHALMD